MSDARHIAKAIEILERFDQRGRVSPEEAIEWLASFPPFEDMDDEELRPIATAALARRGPSAPALPPQQRAGGRARPARPAPTTRPAPDAAVLTAPYRFVVIPDQVVPAQKRLQEANWGFPIKGGFCGAIEVEWAFETPMLIGVEQKEKSGKKEEDVSAPMKLGGDYVIPGATLRGMMRAAMGIVCRARLTQVNTNHRYGVRDFTHPLFREEAGAQRLAWDNLRTGWLRKLTEEEKARHVTSDNTQKLSDYVLTSCDKAMVRIRALPRSFNNGKPTDNGEWHRAWLGTKLGERYEKARYVKSKTEGKKPTYVFDFEDMAKAESFSRDPAGKPGDQDYVSPGGAGGRKGWFVFSNNSPSHKNIDPATLDAQQKPPQGDQKKREYVFFDRPGPEEVRLTQEAFERFERINSKPGKTKLKPDGSYAVMAETLESGKRIPVFYVGDPDPERDDKDFAIGLTRLFKLPHANSVGDVLARQAEHQRFFKTEENKLALKEPDMVEALFGYVYDRGDIGLSEEEDERLAPGQLARKGRIAFGFAHLAQETPAAGTDVITTTAMAPRASYAPFYLRGPIKDWTDEATNGRKGDARLSGRKRYFPRFPADRRDGAVKRIEETLLKRKSEDATDTQSRLRLLRPETPGGDLIFRGTIRLHNVTAEEIGALLWTLTHGGDPKKPYRHMIGRAKNAGAGQVRVKSVKLALTANDGSDVDTNLQEWERSTESSERWTAGGQSLEPFFKAFENYMREEADSNWPQTDDICEFLGVCDPAKGAELKADFLPTPNLFGRLRRLVKADVQSDPAPVTNANDRLLPAPKVQQIMIG